MRDEAEHLAERPAGLLGHLLGQLGLVDDRQRDGVADAVDGQEQQRDEDLLPQFGDREDRDQLAASTTPPHWQ